MVLHTLPAGIANALTAYLRLSCHDGDGSLVRSITSDDAELEVERRPSSFLERQAFALKKQLSFRELRSTVHEV